MELVCQGIRARDIVTKKSFENAILVHAAISGSTNAIMRIPAIAHEFGIELDAQTFDRMHRGVHYLLNIRPSGDWPAQYFYYTGEAICADPKLAASVALITDCRFSGASCGPVIGHVSPEAAAGGPIALVEDGDLVRIDIPGRRLDLVGIQGQEKSQQEMAQILAQRKARWPPQSPPNTPPAC